MHPFGERLSRRRLLALGGAMLAAELTGLRGVLAKTGPAMPIRIGVVTPTKTGGKAIEASLYDVVGEAARMGALLAEGDVGTEAEELGMHLDILPASSPSAEAALRAGERLVATEEVCALVGGIGEDQAEVLAQVAANAGLPFFNIGSQ
ncbi:MAG TPA: hypothetical protein VF171_08705, partial [Trueperaceae bacterium]